MSHFADDETLTHIAALEAEVLRLRGALKHIKYETDIHGNNLNRGIKDEAVKVLSTQFTPTALNELIEKVEKMTIERCAGGCKTLDRKEKRHAAGYGPGYLTYTASDCEQIIRALPNVTLDELL